MFYWTFWSCKNRIGCTLLVRLMLTQVSCACKPWFAGKNCQINLKLLLIVGAVSATLMMLIACGVSCFCCKDRRKRNIPSKQIFIFPRIKTFLWKPTLFKTEQKCNFGKLSWFPIRKLCIIFRTFLFKKRNS